MGASSSHLRTMFQHCLKVSDVDTAFNICLVIAGIRPSFSLEKFAPNIKKVFSFYPPKHVSVKQDCVTSLKFHEEGAWPQPNILSTPVHQALDSNVLFHVDAIIRCVDKNTKHQSSSVFYSFQTPKPLSNATKTNLYNFLLKTYHLATTLSDDKLFLQVDVDKHSKLSSRIVQMLKTNAGADHTQEIQYYLTSNGFQNIAQRIQMDPSLLQQNSFRIGVLNPVLFLEQSGLLTSLNTSLSEKDEYKQKWSETLLASVHL